MKLKATVSYEEAVACIQAMQAKGENPTIVKLRAALEDRVSVPVASRYLKQWRESVAPELPGLSLPEAPVKSPVLAVKPVSVEVVVPVVPQAVITPEVHEVVSPVKAPEVRPVSPRPNPPKPASVRPPLKPVVKPEVSVKTEAPETAPVHANSNSSSGVSPGKEMPVAVGSYRRVVDFEKPYPVFPEKSEAILKQEQEDPIIIEDESVVYLSTLPKEKLISKIRQSHSMLLKAKHRVAVSEKLVQEAKLYTESVKGMVADRIQATRQELQKEIDRLNLAAKEAQRNTESELLRYHRQLDQANQKIVELLTTKPGEPVA